MSHLLTSEFRVRQANFFVQNIDTETVFMFAGKTLPYNDSNPQIIEKTVQQEFYGPHIETVFGKYVSSEDYSVMIPYVEWESGVVYTQYDHKAQLEDTNFYVTTLEASQYSVFKCLYNNNGAPSTDMPVLSETSPVDEFYQTSDGYIWKFMYVFDDVTYSKFATPQFIPLVANAEVSNAAVSGAIDVVQVTTSGQGYTNNAEGIITSTNVGGNTRKFYIESTANTSLSANSGFYTDSAVYISSGPGAGQLRRITDYGFESSDRFIFVDSPFDTPLTTSSTISITPNLTLNGDGTGFKGRLIVDTVDNSIDYVEVIDRGTGYTYADAVIGANNAAINTISFSTAELDVIIPPFGGHGFNQQMELFGRYVCVSETFSGDEVPTANNDYRTFGLMQNPEFNTAILDLDSVSGLAINDVVTQPITGALGTISSIDVANSIVTMDTVSGIFDTSSVESGNTSYTVTEIVYNNEIVDQRIQLDVTLTDGTSYTLDELVIQENTGAEGYVHGFANNTIFLIQTKGIFEVSIDNEVIGQTSATRSTINSITQPDAVRYSGEILYIENIDPVTRLNSSSETIKIIIGF